MIGDHLIKHYLEYKSPHSLFGVIASSVLQLQLVLDDNLTSYGTQGAMNAVWIPSGTVSPYGIIASDWIYFKINRISSANDNYMNRALGVTLSDTAWVFRYKKISSATTTDNTFTADGSMALCDGDFTSTSWGAGTFDFIQEHYTVGTSGNYVRKLQSGDATNPSSPTTTVSFAARSAATEYMEMKRLTSTTISLEEFSDSAYTTSVESQNTTCAATVDGLDRISFVNFNPGSPKTPAVTLTITDFLIYDGVTSI